MSTILQAETGIHPSCHSPELGLGSSSVQTRQVPRPWERWRELGRGCKWVLPESQWGQEHQIYGVS